MLGIIKLSCGLGFDAALGAGVGYLGAKTFTRIIPGIGVLYGGTLGLISSVVRRIMDTLYPTDFNTLISTAIATLPARALVNYTGFAYLSLPAAIGFSLLICIVSEISQFPFRETIRNAINSVRGG